MSSVQQQPQTTTATTEPESLLDAAIAATARNKTLTEKAADSLGVPAESLLQILRGVWTTSKGEPDLTQAEMFVGIGIVAKYGLDPIAREIYVTKNKGKMMTVIGIDGWIKILDRTEHYDGFEIVIHMIDNGTIDYVDATIHSKLRKYPSTYRAFMKEYTTISGFMAGKIPTHMLRIFALRHAARLFVPLGGTVMMEEEANFIIGDKQPAASGSRVRPVDISDFEEIVEPEAEPEKKPPKKPDKGKNKPATPEPTGDSADDFDAAVASGKTKDMFADGEGEQP